MANVRNANTFHIDTSGTATAAILAIPNIQLVGVIMASTADSAILELSDLTTAATKIYLTLNTAAAISLKFIDLSNSPIVFPNGILPTTVTNCIATCIIRESRS